MNYQESGCASLLKIKSGIHARFTKPEQVIERCENITVDAMNDDENKWLDYTVPVPFSFEDQIRLILLAIQAKEKFYNDAADLCKSLQRNLGIYFSSALNVKLYGSVATHLALKDSDVDLYIDFHLFSEYRRNPDGLTQFFRKLMQEHILFKEIHRIDALVPIFKAVTLSGLQCDISFTSALGLYKSDLINFFMSADDRIQQLTILLKFWLKKQDLYGGDINKIGSFALISLVIFYLQQGENPMLPSVFSLQRPCTSKEIIEGWVISFAKTSSQITTDISLRDMLKQFFDFYATFDFQNKVISPFIGRVIPKINFSQNIQSFPLEFEYLKKNLLTNRNGLKDFNNEMCVQDFIVHNCNITKNVGEKITNKFKQACLIAHNIFVQELRQKLDGNNRQSDLFYELFKPIECEPETNSFLKPLKLSKPNTDTSEMNNFIKVVQTSEIPKLKGYNTHLFQNGPTNQTMKILELFLMRNNENHRDLDSNEINRFFTFLYSLLTKVMKCEVMVQDKDTIKTYQCKTDNHVLTKSYRKSVLKEYRKTKKESVLEIAEKFSKSSTYSKQEFKIGQNSAFDIVCFSKNNPSRIEIHFICKEKRKHRALVNEIIQGLFSVLMKWTILECL